MATSYSYSHKISTVVATPRSFQSQESSTPNHIHMNRREVVLMKTHFSSNSVNLCGLAGLPVIHHTNEHNIVFSHLLALPGPKIPSQVSLCMGMNEMDCQGEELSNG